MQTPWARARHVDTVPAPGPEPPAEAELRVRELGRHSTLHRRGSHTRSDTRNWQPGQGGAACIRDGHFYTFSTINHHKFPITAATVLMMRSSPVRRCPWKISQVCAVAPAPPGHLHPPRHPWPWAPVPPGTCMPPRAPAPPGHLWP